MLGDFNFYGGTIYYSGDPQEELALKLVNDIIDNDMQTVNNITVASGLLMRAENKGIDVSEEAGYVQDILNKTVARQEEIENAEEFDVKKREHDSSFRTFVENELAKEGSTSGIGAAASTLLGVSLTLKYLVAAGLITAGAIITAKIIEWLQVSRDESEIQFDQSRQAIQNILSKLDDEDEEKLVGEINSQLQDAYKKGKWEQFWHTWGGIVRNIGLIIVGTFLVLKGVPWVSKKLKESNNK